MGTLLDRVLKTSSSERSLDDYITVDAGDEGVETGAGAVANRQLHVADISSNKDLLEVKDAIYAGDIIVADITSPNNGMTTDRVVDRLEIVVNEVGGDIAHKSGGELLITPREIQISRTKIGQ